MAKQFDAGVEDALRRASAVILDRRPGVWNLAFEDGLMPARARIRNGWFEVSAPLPDAVLSKYDDVWALRVNARLHARARVARPYGEAPFVRADVFIEHHDDPFDRVRAAYLDATRVVAALADPMAEVQRLSAIPVSDLLPAEIVRACVEAGWHLATQDGSKIRVDLPTRAGVYSPRIQSCPPGDGRLVVELADLSGYSAVSTQAVSALLMAVSASVWSVSGLMCDREGALLAVLAAPLESPLDGSVDRALSALSVACALAGRETIALRDPQLASQYLALCQHTSKGVRPLFSMKKGSDPFFEEEEPCLEQP